MPSIWEIIGWILYGMVRYVLFWIPLLNPPRVDRSIPPSWWKYNNWSDWGHRNANNGYPDLHWIESWLEMAFGELKAVAVEDAKTVIFNLTGILYSYIGSLPIGFRSVADWLSTVERRTGLTLPSWAWSVIHGLGKLFDWLPVSIRNNWQTWENLWDSIATKVEAWAKARYDDAKSWASNAWSWVQNRGLALRTWYDNAHSWLDDFRQNARTRILNYLGTAWGWLEGLWRNPYGIIAGILGPNWTALVSWVLGPLWYYYNLWGKYASLLSLFLNDPLTFIWDKIETYILEKKW